MVFIFTSYSLTSVGLEKSCYGPCSSDNGCNEHDSEGDNCIEEAQDNRWFENKSRLSITGN